MKSYSDMTSEEQFALAVELAGTPAFVGPFLQCLAEQHRRPELLAEKIDTVSYANVPGYLVRLASEMRKRGK